MWSGVREIESCGLDCPGSAVYVIACSTTSSGLAEAKWYRCPSAENRPRGRLKGLRTVVLGIGIDKGLNQTLDDAAGSGMTGAVGFHLPKESTKQHDRTAMLSLPRES